MNIDYKIDKNKLKNLEVFFCDVDGTLINKKGELSERTIKVIKNFNKDIIPFILISGRNISGLKRFYKQLELDTPIVTLNGSCTFYNNKVFDSITIDKEIQKELMNVLLEYNNDISISLFNEDKWYVNKLNNIGLQREINLVNEYPTKEIDERDFYSIPINKIMVIAKEEKCKELVNKLGKLKDDLYIINNYSTYIEIFSKKVDKAKAIINLKKLMKFNLERIIVAGDTKIDIPMLELAKFKVTPMNAKQEIKDLANIIIPSNEDSGVSYLVEDIKRIKEK